MQFSILFVGRVRIVLLAALFLVLTVPLALQAQEREDEDEEREMEELEMMHRRSSEDELSRMTQEDVRGREAWFRFQRAFPYGLIPAGARSAAVEQVQRLAAASRSTSKDGRPRLLAVPQWEQIGPSNVSGRTRGIAIDPVNDGTLYIGAAAGGVWKTVNNGGNWSTTTDTLSALSMGSLAVAPSNPSIIYAGTGENTSNIDSYLGNGVFRSTDGGQTWRNVGLQNVGAISRIAVHSTNPDIVYVASNKSNGGFYRTENGGGSWSRTFTTGLFDLAMNPSNPSELYIAGSNFVRHSTDGGQTFTLSTSGITVSGSLRISVAIAASQPTRAYALVASSISGDDDNEGRIYVTNNSGTSWSLLFTFPSGNFPNTFFNGQGWYDNCLAVSPFDPNVVLAGGIDIYKSGDGGNSWENTTRSYTGGSTHPDQHIVLFSPSVPGVVYLGNDGGIYTSVDDGSNWTKISTALPTTQFYAVDVDQTRPFRAYGGSQDNGTWGSFGTSGFTQTWNRILSGDGFFTLVDLSDPNVVYAEQFNGSPLYRINASNTNDRRVIDGQISSSGDDGYWNTPIAMSPADKKTLYSGRNGLWRTTNRGTSWSKLAPLQTNEGKITAIGLSPFNAGHMMVGTGGGLLRWSTNDGSSWSTSTGVPARFITDIRYDPVTQGRVYVTLSGFSSGHVYRSDDFGATFTNISANLPDIPANTIEIDSANNTHLFLGTDAGAMVSLDGGRYWFPFNEGLPLSPTVWFKIHRSSRMLVAATHGRSAFRVSLDGIVAKPGLITPSGGETFTTPTPLTIRWAGFSGPVTVEISYDGGLTWHTIGSGVTGDSLRFDLPLIRSTSTLVRVTGSQGEGSVKSDEFTLTATANAVIVSRNVVAEAIEMRKSDLWATVRGNDSLYKFTSPLLTNRRGLVRTGIPGRVRDLAYSPSLDIFYALVTADDFSSPKLYRMDSTGAGRGQVTLPPSVTQAAGVAVVPEGIAIASPGPATSITIIDTAGTVVQQLGALGSEPPGTLRASLVWDLLGYVQGVVYPGDNFFRGELQNIAATDPLVIRERRTVIPSDPAVNTPIFFGLAFDQQNSDVDKRIYWATDTSGVFYKMIRESFFSSGVEVGRETGASTSSVLTLESVQPNPAHDRVTLALQLTSARTVRVELRNALGELVGQQTEQRYEPGRVTVSLDVSSYPSGLYYVVARAGAGERSVRPLSIVR